MLENTEFTYDGVHTSKIGGIQCQVDGGLFEEKFLPNRGIVEEKIRGREVPYFMDFEYESFTFPINLYFEESDKEKRREVARLFSANYYKPLVFDSNPDRIFYCMYEGDFDWVHNGQSGYVTLIMKCNGSYSYTPVYTSRIYDLSQNESTELIEIENHGDGVGYPLLLLSVAGNGDIKISNLNDGYERDMILTELLDGDELEIDCFDGSIETKQAGVFRYDNHNDVFIRLVRGVNRLKIEGKCFIKFKYQFPLYQG